MPFSLSVYVQKGKTAYALLFNQCLKMYGNKNPGKQMCQPSLNMLRARAPPGMMTRMANGAARGTQYLKQTMMGKNHQGPLLDQENHQGPPSPKKTTKKVHFSTEKTT